MITEHATLTVDAAHSTEFESAIIDAESVLRSAPGYLGYDLSRCVEIPEVYLLRIRWRTLEDHTVHFRNNGLDEWRRIVGPHIADAQVRHFTSIESPAAH